MIIFRFQNSGTSTSADIKDKFGTIMMKPVSFSGEIMTAVFNVTEPHTTEDTTISDNFMAEVETYVTFQIATTLNVYWFPILVPIGLVGNTLSFLVMIKPSNRKTSTCIYMAVLSINDNLMMCLALYDWLISVVHIHQWYLLECKIFAFLVFLGLLNSTFQVVFMTMDKYIAIKWPHRAATYSTPRKTRIIVFGTFVSVTTFNIPHLFISNIVGGECVGYVTGGRITKVYSWSTFVINATIPFSMLIYMNLIIVKTVRKSNKLFGNKGIVSGYNTQNVINKAIENRQRILKSVNNQLTIMLLLVTTLFLILLIPTYVRFIYWNLIRRDSPSVYASSMLFFQITYKLYVTNSGINFFLYCSSGQKFRRDLKEIICCVTNKTDRSLTTATDRSQVTDDL